MPTFKKATKYNSFLKLGIAGPPGSGKSYSALSIATHLSEKRIAVIDAEMGSASKYAHLFDFDVNEITLDDNGREVAKPYSPQRYMDAIKSAYEVGEYDVLIIDGITPEWNDAGGCLQWVDQIVRGNDTRSAWKVVKPVHQDFINTILRVRMHVIVTMLAKKEMIAAKGDNGKVLGQKVTLDPIQQDDVPRVFDVFALMQNREMIIEKTRCPELDEQTFHKPGKEVADILREWLKGDPMPERPDYTLEPRTRQDEPTDMPCTDQQIASVRKLCQHLDRSEPENITSMMYLAAKKLIQQLTDEYKEIRLETGSGARVQAPSGKEIYELGVERGTWKNGSEFYTIASIELSIVVNKETRLTPEQRLTMLKVIEREPQAKDVA